jgi:hypothetical protein
MERVLSMVQGSVRRLMCWLEMELVLKLELEQRVEQGLEP